jgi:hypothetical protein
MNTTKKFYRGLGITVIAFGTGVSWTAMNAPFNAASFSLPSFNLAASDPSPNTNSDPRVTDARYAALDERFRKATGVGAKPSEATRYSDSSKAGVTGSPLGFNLVGQVASASNGANGTSADCEAAPISSASAAARNGQSNFTAGDGNACSSGGDLPNTSSIPTFSMGSAMAWNQPVDPNLDPIPGPTPFPSPAPIPGPIILPPHSVRRRRWHRYQRAHRQENQRRQWRSPTRSSGYRRQRPRRQVQGLERRDGRSDHGQFPDQWR